ncbi:MAG TPA: hypothetical protein VF607_02990, partial [Verrucomicrobiae bacterium]
MRRVLLILLCLLGLLGVWCLWPRPQAGQTSSAPATTVVATPAAAKLTNAVAGLPAAVLSAAATNRINYR